MTSNTKVALIFGNGSYQNPLFYKKVINEYKNTFMIAVDGGYNFLRLLDFKPDLLIGDMDSIKYSYDKLNYLKVDPVKDETDTRLALDYCLEHGYNSVVMFGMISSERIDHSIANIFLMEKYVEKGMTIKVINQFNELFCLKGPDQVEFNNLKDKTISLLPLTSEVKGVCITGVKYPLDKVDLKRTEADFTVSNEILADHCLIKFSSGILLIDLIDNLIF